MSAYLDLPRRSESDALLDRYRRERATRLHVRGSCSVCRHFDPGTAAFGYCPYLGKREADEPPCGMRFERVDDVGEGDVGSAGQ